MKITVFHYSQTGQATVAAQNLFDVNKSIGKKIETIIYKAILPVQEYPFPWNKYEFFDTFPETRLGMPPSGIQPINFSDIIDTDLVVIVGQSWFLSPSLPLQSFFADKLVREYLLGRNVIFVNVCRNMWVMTIRWVKNYTQTIGANLIGHIVLQDKTPNLISATTIVRWLIHGKKNASGLLPSAGVADEELQKINRFGEIIIDNYKDGKISHLQSELLAAGAISYRPFIAYIEQTGYQMFGSWAKFIRKKGGFRDINRKTRVRLFYYYLIVALFVVSPFAQLLFYLTYYLHQVSRRKEIDCNV